jgi:hypothetical protein
LPKLSSKVVELLLATASHFYRSEDILQKKLEIYFFDDDEDFLASLRAEAEAARAARLARENAQTDTTNTAASGGGEASGGTESGASGETSTAAADTTGATGSSEATATASAGGTTGEASTSDSTGGGNTGTSGAPSTSETVATGTATEGTTGTEQQAEVRPPRVDPLYLGQLCDMGFSREQGERALLVCGNDLPTAMEWILTRHPGAPEVQVRFILYSI